MSRFCTIASSSKGNCAYLSGGGTALLVDAGISCKAITRALNAIGGPSPAGIFVTHEHTDHIRGLRVLLSRLKIPVYGSPGTLEALVLGGHLPPETELIEMGDGVEVGGIQVRSFDTPHDAAQPCGYRFSMPDGRKIGVATDLGRYDEGVAGELSGCDLVLLESNYDPAMLRSGPYPWSLKQRIAGARGHLSNDDCGDALAGLLERGATRFVLAHLSLNNNYPGIAYQTARNALDQAGAQEGSDYLLSVAHPCELHPMIVF